MVTEGVTKDRIEFLILCFLRIADYANMYLLYCLYVMISQDVNLFEELDQ